MAAAKKSPVIIVLDESVDDFVQRLVDHVSTVTQLDPDKGQLPNAEDWARCLRVLLMKAKR